MSRPTDSNITAVPQSRPAIGRPQNVEVLGNNPVPANPGLVNSGSINSGLACGSQVSPCVIKPVDRRTIEGSTPGDFRAPNLPVDITAPVKNPPNPRERVGQFPLSSRTPAAPAPIETDDGVVGD